MTRLAGESAQRRTAAHGRPVRLLLAIDEMEVGGTQRQIVQLARALDPARFVIEVVYFRFSSFLVDELASLGVTVHHCPKSARIDPGFVLALRRLVARGRYDLVHAFSFSSELWCAVVLMLTWPGRRPPLFSSVRGTYEWYGAMQWRIKRWVTARSSAVVANSQAGARYAADHLAISPAAITLVYNGMPAPAPALCTPAARALTRQTLGLAADTVLLLFVGRLVEIKNVTTLLDALARVDSTRPFRLAIVGDGPLRAGLQAQAGRLGLDPRIDWLGERRDVPALMQASDVVILPSWREGMSNVILEAMFMGRAVLASRAGGNVEAVQDEHTGILVDPGDADAMAAAISRLIADPALVGRLGEAGRRRAHDCFGLPALAARMSALYLGALGRPVSAPAAGEPA